MSVPQFPFTALVGLETLKLALQLAAIDRRLSVLVRGDKGTGKSTAARALAALLESQAPFVTLPIGATEDRLLGGLDVDKAIKGEPSLKPGLLSEAHGGVLYVDEVNLLPDHLADALLDAVASGVHVVEREGFSATHAADFVLLGSMNLEEGTLRPQLLDRFALCVDVEAPADIDLRCEVLDRRLSFDRDPAVFVDRWDVDQRSAAEALKRAREAFARVPLPRDVMRHASARVVEHDVRSLRADLAIIRASRACAALEGSDAVTVEHVERVLSLALAHRMRTGPRRPPPPPSTPPPQNRSPERDSTDIDRDDEGGARIFQPAHVDVSRVAVEHRGDRTGQGAADTGMPRGPVIATRRSDAPGEVDLRQSLLHSVTHTGSPNLNAEHLFERVRAPRAATRFILVVDSSGSHAIQERMRLVKGAVTGLLDASHGRHDDVVVIACRGSQAQVVVEPTSSRDDAVRALEYLPTGGRTPLAHALELAAGYVTDHAIIVVITDGHANVPSRGDDGWTDALAAARALRGAGLIIDTEDLQRATGRPRMLAEAMGAACLRLDDLAAGDVIRVLREIA